MVRVRLALDPCCSLDLKSKEKIKRYFSKTPSMLHSGVTKKDIVLIQLHRALLRLK